MTDTKKLCPCGQHEIKYTGATLGPWWQGDTEQPILICPHVKDSGIGHKASEGYIAVTPDVTGSDIRMAWTPVWAIETNQPTTVGAEMTQVEMPQVHT